MKLTNLSIIFFIIIISFITVLDIRTQNVVAINNKKIQYDLAIDTAVDDGIYNLVEIDSKRNLVLNKEDAINQFYTSLYSNFGVLGSSRLEEKIKYHIPVILITDQDGFYINYADTYNTGNEKLMVRKWSEKYPYSYQENNLIYKFTLSDYVSIYDSTTNIITEGNFEDVANIYPDTSLFSSENFDTYRRSAIINEIENKMNYYVNQYNDIAYQFGITYQFWLPKVDKTDWYRSIDDISMFVLFQGYPYNVGNLDTYNRYAFGGARIKKMTQYYITTGGSGLKYYHKSSCEHLINVLDQEVIYFTREECALNGAFPCPDCNP